MATKLDKNFGLGNSYKNVKLVKSAVRKVDAEVEEELSDKVTTEQMNTAIALAVAGRLPVYHYDNVDETLILTLQFPCIIEAGSDIYLLLNDNDRITGLDVYTDNPDIACYLISPHDGTSLTVSEWIDAINIEQLATYTYVNTNKGTKLYKHLFTKNDLQWRFSVISTYGDKWEGGTQGQYLISGLVSMSCMYGNAQYSSNLGLPVKLSFTGNGLYLSYLDLTSSITTTNLTILNDSWTDEVTPL